MSKGIIFRVSLEEAQLIGNALAELPYKFSSGLIANLQGQLNMQLQEPPAEAVNAPIPELKATE